MLTNPILLSIATIALVGCTSPKTVMNNNNAKVITARKASKEEGATGVTDKFSLEGKIYAYATFQWEVGVNAGKQEIVAKWFSGEKLVSESKVNCDFSKTPHFVWFSTSPTAIGVGKGRVDICSNNTVVASHEFDVGPTQ